MASAEIVLVHGGSHEGGTTQVGLRMAYWEGSDQEGTEVVQSAVHMEAGRSPGAVLEVDTREEWDERPGVELVEE